MKIRADRGDGPSQSVPLPPVPSSVPVPVPDTNANEMQSANFLNQLQNTIKPPPAKTLVPGGQYLPLPPTSMLHKATQNQQSSSNSQPPSQPSHHSGHSHSRHGDPYSPPARGSSSDYHSDDRYDRDRYSKRGRYDR